MSNSLFQILKVEFLNEYLFSMRQNGFEKKILKYLLYLIFFSYLELIYYSLTLYYLLFPTSNTWKPFERKLGKSHLVQYESSVSIHNCIVMNQRIYT